MRVSLNTIKQYTAVDLPVDELVKKINEQLGGVEEVTDLGTRYKDAVIVKVVKCEKHPNADKLSVCEIDAGTGENIQVVCGAPNVREGLMVVWLPPGSTVPATATDAEPFVLEPKELRGVVSNGMLASARELALGDSHDGIVELTDDDLAPGSGVQLSPGLNFAETFGLNDTIIDIENKMFTHRPDLFGQLGVAREIAGIQHNQFTSPDWYANVPEPGSGEGLEFTVANEVPNVVPRFMAVAIKNIEIKPSPLWLRCELVRLGGKPINNVVDVTNYIMLLTAQPTHAYDYDKLRGHYLGTRMARDGEALPLLNGKTYELNETDIVIVDGEGPVGLAGIMGGGNSEVSASTTNLVLEVANFDMYAVRKSSMRHGVFTDALTRFNKGQSPLQNSYVIDLLMKSLFDVAGGEQASELFDKSADNKQPSAVHTSTEFISDRLGIQIKSEELAQLLKNVEFKVDTNSDEQSFEVTAPFWRTDIELPEDIVEEVGRLYGFDKLPRELPMRSTTPAPKNQNLEVKQKIRESMAKAGANEVLTYSFVHEKIMQRAEQDVSQAFQLSNALSPDLQYYRLSVLPSLLDKVHGNIKAGHDEFLLYEIGKGHNKKLHANDDDGLPSEMEFVDGVYASKKSGQGAPYFVVKKYVSRLAADLGIALKFKPVGDMPDYPVTAPFDTTRSALVESDKGEFIGMIGELKPSVRRMFKLPAHTSAMTLDFKGLVAAHAAADQTYRPLSKYPSVRQDISLQVSNETSYEDVFSAVQSAADDQFDMQLSPLSIYQSPESTSHKTITLRMVLTSHERTLKESDASAIMDAATDAASKQLGATRI